MVIDMHNAGKMNDITARTVADMIMAAPDNTEYYDTLAQMVVNSYGELE
jgi:hypothetical protein